MTILQILPELNDGGVERGTVEMAAYIHKQGAKSLVASSGGSREFSVAAEGAKHYTLPLHCKNPLTLLTNAWRLHNLIKAENITHVHARSRAPAWSGWLATRFSGTKFITTFHGTHGLKGVGKKFYNSVMARGDVVVANSEFIAGHIREHYSAYLADRPLLVAPRGADISIFCADSASDEDIRGSLGISPEENMIVQVGRLSRWKGQDVLIRALAKLPISAHLVLVGAPDKGNAYEQELQTLVHDLGLKARVHFVGSQSNVASWYRAADIAVNSSLKPEAFGRTTVESMACGTCTVATAHGGSLEIIKDGQSGVLISPNDVDAIAEALKKYLDNKEKRQRIATAGAKRVKEKFTIEMMCKKEFKAYV